MSRPVGEERKAIRQAAEALAKERLAALPEASITPELVAEASTATWRELGARAGVGFKVAQRTVDNMARSGELKPIGSVKVAHSRRWMNLYQLTTPAAPAPTAPAIDGVMRMWSRL
jgi:hypothetical protein